MFAVLVGCEWLEHSTYVHANSADDAKNMLDRAKAALSPVEALFTEVSPVVGTHAGPGTVGLAYMFD